MGEERTGLEKVNPHEQADLVHAGYPQGYPAAYPDTSSYGYGYGYPEDDERVYLRRMWHSIRKRKWLIATIVLIVTSVVTVEVFRTKSIYQASTTIEVGKEQRTLVRSGDVLLEADDSDSGYFAATAMKTKIRLLESRPLLEDVVVDMKLDKDPRLFDVASRRSIWEAIKSTGERLSGSRELTEAQGSRSDEATVGTQQQRSRQESERLAPYVNVLAANLTAEPVPDTRMLSVSFKHTDPTLAADIVDHVAKVFVQRNFENATERYTKASDWLERSTRELKAKVEESEQKLANYTRENSLYSADGKETLAMEKLTRLHDQLSRAETERMLKESLYAEVKAGRVAQLPDSYADAKLSELQKSLGSLKVSFAEASATYGPKNPHVLELQDRITEVEKQISDASVNLADKLKADYERSVRDENMLRAAFERTKVEAGQQNEAAIQLNMLKSEVDTAKTIYQDFLQKTNQANVQRAEQHNSVRIVDPAQVPVSPIGPNRARTILIGFLSSLAAGIGLALFMEYLDNTIKTVEDIARYTQLPALSVIPELTSGRTRLLKSVNGEKKTGALVPAGVSANGGSYLAALDGQSSAAEAYRVLRTSVLLSSAGNPPKIMLVTSGQPGEGKTTTLVNTAVSLSQLGASVVIVDCDLRRPAAHKAFNVNASRGVSNYLSSMTADLDSLIQKLPIENLSLLPSGTNPPNPAELISSARMRDLLKQLAEKYDHVLVDSPPLLKVTDPVILSTMVDGVILVVHGGKSTRDIVRRARQELSSVGAKIFGVVLNNVDLRHHGYDRYYYDRYYSDYGSEVSGASGD